MNTEDGTLSDAQHSIEIVEKALDLFMKDIIRSDIHKLNHIIHEKGEKIYSSISQAEYNISMAENLKEKRIREIGEIEELEKQKGITEEQAVEAIKLCKSDIQKVYYILANSRKIGRKLDFMWNFLSWKYNTLLSEDMEKIAKTNNRLAIIAVVIAIVSLIISLMY